MKKLIGFAATFLAAWSAQADITIEHAMGTTTLDAPAKRVVTLYQGATDAAVALGIKPVGAVESWTQKPFYHYLRPHLTDIQILGTENQPNLEQIARLKPDVIIASKTRHEKIYPQLKMIAPVVAHETVYIYKESLELVAAATGKEQEAEKWLADWQAKSDAFQQKAKAKFGDQWPLQVTLLNFRADHARIYYQSFAGLVLKDLGFDRPEAHKEEKWGVRLTSKEAIPSMNADSAFIFMYEGDAAVEQTFQDWSNHPLWKTLDSVKNNATYKVDEVAWNLSGGPLGASMMLESIEEHYGL